jgi:hypothetical protein
MMLTAAHLALPQPRYARQGPIVTVCVQDLQVVTDGTRRNQAIDGRTYGQPRATCRSIKLDCVAPSLRPSGDAPSSCVS